MFMDKVMFQSFTLLSPSLTLSPKVIVTDDQKECSTKVEISQDLNIVRIIWDDLSQKI